MALNSKTILVADGDPDVLNYLETALLCDGFRVLTAQDGTEAVKLVLESGQIAAAILALGMPHKDGLTALREVRESVADLPIVILSESSQPSTIVEAMKAGATDYLTKPVAQQDLLAVVNRVTARGAGGPPAAPEPRGESGFLYTHPCMQRIQQSLAKAAPWNVPVLLSGESGVGKEVVARELHRLSPRAKRPLVKINCVALPSELLESELFGYEKGAFTGAFRSKPGKFEMANGGTILLDEIGDMDLKLQAKLLQVLQDSEFHRLGGRDVVQVDARVVVATHRDLERGIAEGWFREDLYYRLSVVTVAVPALRQRREEILPLAQHFLVKHRQPGYEVPGIPLALKTALVAYDWPGNVRELENVIRKLLVFNDTEMIIADLRTSQQRRRPNRAGAWRATAAGGSPDLCAPDPRAADPESTAALATPATLEPTFLEATLLEATLVEAIAPLPQFLPEAFERRLAVAGSPDACAQTAVAEEGGVSGWSERLSELERLIVALIPPSRGHPLTTEHIESMTEKRPESQPVSPLDKVDEEAREHERQAILSALQRTNWNRRKAAAMLRVDYKGLLYRMKKLDIGSTSGDEVE